MPPFPPLAGLHPLAVHFPIALLTTTFALLLAALVVPRRRGVMAALALGLMLLGTLGTYVAVYTGEASEGNAELVPASEGTFEHHEELGERTRLVFTILTLLFAGFVAIGRRLPDRSSAVMLLTYLLAYGWGLTVLANTAHHGGLLVHVYGVHAPQSVERVRAPFGGTGDGEGATEHESGHDSGHDADHH